MKTHLKFSGVKAELPKATAPEARDWKFEFRPGGWVIATRIDSSSGEEETRERHRFHYSRVKDRFFAKFLRAGNSAADFYGQKIEPTRGGAGGPGGGGDFTAQFPGKVRKLLVQDGAKVEAGTPLLMVEAMKMEFAIKADSAGTVKKLLVTEGQQLTPGQKLLEFEVSAAGTSVPDAGGAKK
jgi:biotin carboxyl carrier protein